MVGQFDGAMHSFQRDVADRRSNNDAVIPRRADAV